MLHDRNQHGRGFIIRSRRVINTPKPQRVFCHVAFGFYDEHTKGVPCADTRSVAVSMTTQGGSADH